MSIPHSIDPLGAIGSLPTGFTRLAYLESTGTQHLRIDCDYRTFSNLGASCDYIDFSADKDTPIMSVYRDINGNNRFYVPYCSKGSIYTGYYEWLTIGAGQNKGQRTRAGINLYDSNVYRMSFGEVSLAGVLSASGVDISIGQPFYIFSYTSYVNSRHAYACVFEARITIGKNLVRWLLPALNNSGVPCMYDVVSRQPFYNAGTGGFIAGVEKQEQLDQLLLNLPDRTGQETKVLVIRLTASLATDSQVNYINSIAIPKNWNIAYAA